MLLKFIEFINESSSPAVWYHGTPDGRDIDIKGGFEKRTNKTDYIKDLDGYSKIQDEMKTAKEEGNDDLYFSLLDKVSDYKETYKYTSPIFLTDNYNVAKTYADPKRAFDYQNAEEKVYRIEAQPSQKTVSISAYGEPFRFINADYVKRGFVNAGIPEEKITKLINQFNYYTNKKGGIQTDMIAAIGDWLGFDYIDVKGVLDSYMGGNIKSTVRMVLNPDMIKISE